MCVMCQVRKECKELEEVVEWPTCAERMLEGDLSWSEKMKDDIRRVDHEQKYTERAPLIAEVETERLVYMHLGEDCGTLP